MPEVEGMRDVPTAVDDEVDDDVFAEVVAVLERKLHRTLDVCNTLSSAGVLFIIG